MLTTMMSLLAVLTAFLAEQLNLATLNLSGRCFTLSTDVTTVCD